MAFFEIRGGIPLRGSDRERRKERCTADNMCIDNGR